MTIIPDITIGTPLYTCISSRPARRLSAAVALLAFCAASAGAQGRPVQFGLEAGAAITTLVGDDALFTKRRTSPFIGFTAIRQRPGSSIGFQSGLQLISKGASFDDEAGLSGALRLRYLEVPLLLRFAPALAGSRLQPAVTVGAAVGMRIGCSVSVAGEGFNAAIDCDEEAAGGEADFKRFEAGVVVGAELGIPYRERLLIVPMVRYTRGLTKIADAATGEDDIRNSVFQLGVGLRFRR